MTQPAPDDDAAPAGDDSADGDQGASRAQRSARVPAVRTPAFVDQGAGWVLGLLVWGWVVLPFVKGGPKQVKKVWMAKFLNKAPDGSFLP